MSWTMETVYLGCAAAGGTILVVQTGMMLFGGASHDGDVMHADPSGIGHSGSGDHSGGGSGLSLLSVRSVAAFLTFFGLAGWGGTTSGWGTFQTIGVALAAGVVMLFAVAWLFSFQSKLFSQGNLDPKQAVGCTARVSLRIPGQSSGKGKITVSIQGRTHEFSASTAGAEIATGREVKVVRQITQDTFEVEGLA